MLPPQGGNHHAKEANENGALRKGRCFGILVTHSVPFVQVTKDIIHVTKISSAKSWNNGMMRPAEA